MSSNWKRLIVALLLAVVVYGAFVAYAGFRDIRTSMAGFRYSALAVALALASFNYVLRFLKWEYYLARLNIRGIPKIDSLLIFLSGFVLTVTPGKVGEVFKSAVLSSTHGVDVARTAPIVIAERLTDVIGVIVLILIGSIGFAGGLDWAAAGAGAVVAGLLLILWPVPAARLVAWLETGPAKLRDYAPKVQRAYGSLRIIATPTALLWPSLLSVVGWGAEGLALHVLLDGFQVAPPLTLSIFFYATATLAGAIIPVPGGLGVTEAMIQEQLVRLGSVPQAPATSAMILIRFATLWWAVLVGFVALAILRRRFPGLLSADDEVAAGR